VAMAVYKKAVSGKYRYGGFYFFHMCHHLFF
jgi:hypothetical protein